MMRLETMWRVLEFLQEDSTQLIEEMLARWGNDIDDVHFFRSSANFLFSFQMSNKPYFLRFNHESERTVEAIEQELAFVEHLAERGLSVAKPIPSLNDNLVESVPSTLGTFHVAVFEALEGKQYDLDELSSEQLSEWGRTLGELHEISNTFPVVERPAWQTQLDWINNYLPQEEKVALDVAKKLEQTFASLPVSEDTYGFIHFDFELDNIVWKGDKAKALDFDDCAYCWFVADIAFALRDLFDDHPEKVDLNHASLKTFAEGYRSVKPLTDNDLALIPLFLCFHNLLMFAKLLRSRENLALKNCPEWTQQLDEKLKRKVESYRENFASALNLF